MLNYSDVARAFGYFTDHHGQIDRIESLNEYWLAVDARLRQDFNITGQKPSDTDINRSKQGMRETFRRAGIPCTTGERIESGDQLRRFAGHHGFP